MITAMSNKEIVKQDYNLAISTYIESENTNPPIDINMLNFNIKEIVKKGNVLRDRIDEFIAEMKEN